MHYGNSRVFKFVCHSITLCNLRIYNNGHNITLCYKIDKYSMIAIASFAAVGFLTVFAQIGGN